ncbi:MAG: DUF3955 domain-containing protein [Rhodobiaceae bacterium]|nr:DUF3955 domain-containing protein [Rhodobiaceae bacterium]
MKSIVKISKTKSFKLSLAFLLLGALFLFLENTFYQYLDSDGVLHESLFLPLGAISIVLGGLGLIFVAIKSLIIRLIVNKTKAP